MEAKSSISEDDGELNIVNENGKRPLEDNDVNKRVKVQETDSLFNSNLSRLRVEEILQEVKVKVTTVKRFLEWFTNFKNDLLAIPPDDTESDMSTT